MVLSQTAGVNLLSLCCLNGDSSGSLHDSTWPSRGQFRLGHPETPALFLGSWGGGGGLHCRGLTHQYRCHEQRRVLRAARGLRWHRAGAMLPGGGCGGPGGPCAPAWAVGAVGLCPCADGLNDLETGCA